MSLIKHNPKTLRELFGYIADPQACLAAGINNHEREDARHVYNVLNRLASPNVINPPRDMTAAEERHAFDLKRFLLIPSYYVAQFQSGIEPATVANLTHLILKGLAAWANVLPREKRCRVLVCIDDAAQVISASLPSYLELCRSVGISFVLRLQSLSQLRGPRGLDLIETFKSLPGIKIFHECANDEATIAYLQSVGGPGLYRTTTVRRRGTGETLIEIEGEHSAPLLEGSELPRFSADSDVALFEYRRGVGAAAPLEGRLLPVRLPWIMSREEWAKYDRPWMRGEPGTVVVREEPPELPPLGAKPRRPRPHGGPREERDGDRSAFDFGS